MRFYQSSTASKRLNQGEQYIPNSLYDSLHLNARRLGEYFNEFLQISNNLNQQLIINNSLINNSLINSRPIHLQQILFQTPFVHKEKLVSTEDERKSNSQYNPVIIQQKIRSPKKSKQKLVKIQKEDSQFSSDNYGPQDDLSIEISPLKVSESKNIPKNYGKAITNFIKKNEVYTIKLMAYLGYNYEKFMQSIEQLKGKLNSISQLRSLWLDGDNQFAKAFRIITIQYLRKHSFSYIFNSRVQNFHKHIKYRHKIIESVKNPQHFTSMKEF